MLNNFSSEFDSFVRSAGPASRFRLAPTPSGFLHAGNALNFVLNWLAARAHTGARILLRIDDLDADRKRPEYVTDVFETLDWLGLDWDEGPRDNDDFEQNWSQHLRLPLYSNTLNELRTKGGLFACAKSRRELEEYEGKYPLSFRNQGLSLDAPSVAWRIRTPDGFPLPDFVVRRRDGIPAYQIASLTDDQYFRVTHIIRGADLLESTQAQLFMAEYLDWAAFTQIRFLHHPLLTDSTGGKLSKSAGATALRTLRSAGHSPEIIFKSTASLIGLRPENIQTAQELLYALKNAL